MPQWMKPLIGLLAALVVLYVVLKIPKTTKSHTVPRAPKAPVRLELKRPDIKIVFVKKDGKWRLDEPVRYPADEETLDDLLKSLTSLEVGGILTNRPESHALYEVTDSSGVQVSVWAGEGEKPASWIFGKMASDFLHIYVRPADEPNVYLASGLRKSDLGKELSRWRDRRVWEQNPDDPIVAVQVRHEKGSFEIKRSSDQWVSGNKTIEDGKVQNFLSDLRVLSAEEFVDLPPSEDLKKYGLEPARRHVNIEMESGKIVRLIVGNKDSDKGRIVLKREGQDVLFWIPDYQWDGITAFSENSST